ncbi:MAG: DUF5330 domain-containing protein [Stappiaceae bacterium]
MFFLFRTAFWLGLVLLILPIGTDDSGQTSTSQINAWQAYDAAKETIQDISGFCGRAPGACDAGSDILQTIGQKAKAGAHYVFEYMEDSEGNGPHELITGSTPDGSDAGTLLKRDKVPEWKGPLPRDRPV